MAVPAGLNFRGALEEPGVSFTDPEAELAEVLSIENIPLRPASDADVALWRITTDATWRLTSC